MPQALAVVGAVASVAGTVASMNAQKKAAAAAAQQERLANQRQNRQAIREAQIARAQAANTAAQVGGLGGSGIAGGMASVQSQLGSGLGFASQMTALSQQITKYTQKAQLWGDIAGLGSMAFKAGGGWQGVKDTFAKSPTAAPANPGMTTGTPLKFSPSVMPNQPFYTRGR